MIILHQFYRNSIRNLFIILVVIWLLYTTFILPLFFSWLKAININSDLVQWIINVLSSTSVLGILYFIFERLIRKFLWKIIHPELNFSGTWEGETRYTSCIDPSIGKKSIDGFSKIQYVIFEQDCLGIRIVNSERKFFQWRSLALELNDYGEMDMVYQVDYFDKLNGEGDIAFGYENMQVSKTKRNKYPIEMRGTFKHCISFNNSMFGGDVTYSRKDKK